MAQNGGEGASTNPPRRLLNEQALQALREYSEPVATVSDLDDALRASKPTIRDRLEELEGEGEVTSSTKGRTTVWWVSSQDESDGDSARSEPAQSTHPPVTDGAVDFQGSEGIEQLLQSNREMIQETRALRAQRQQLARKLNSAKWWVGLFSFGLLTSIVQVYINLPEPLLVIAALSLIAGALCALYVLATAAPVEEPQTNTPGISPAPDEQEDA